jgi:hypothetical protein
MWLIDLLLHALLALRDPPVSGEPPRRHPYESRTAMRLRLPRFLIKLGLAAPGRDCESVGAPHLWYNQDGLRIACYHCKVVRSGHLSQPPPAQWSRTTNGQD